MGKLAGYKTIITAVLAALAALGAWLTGDTDLKATLQQLWTVLEPLALVFLATKGNKILGAVKANGTS